MTENGIVPRGDGSTAIRKWSDEEITLIKDICCPDATDPELKMFLYVCKNSGLDPLLKQIHAVKRYDSNLGRKVMSFQTGIDGFRMIAEDTGQYRGVIEGEWYDKGDQEKGIAAGWTGVWTAAYPPDAARIGVLREGFDQPIMAVANWHEYKQTKKDGNLTKTWKDRGAAQLMKCAESLAFRKAFPRRLGGLFTNEEMSQADNNQEQPVQQPQRQSDVVDAEVVGDGETFWRGKIVSGEIAGESQDPNKPWTLHVLKGHDGMEFTTFSETLFDEGRQYKEDGAVVNIEWDVYKKEGQPDSHKIVTMTPIKGTD